MINKSVLFVSVLAVFSSACSELTSYQRPARTASSQAYADAPLLPPTSTPKKQTAATSASTEPEFQVDCKLLTRDLPSNKYLVYLGDGEKMQVRKGYEQSMRSEDVVPVGTIAIVDLTSRSVPMYLLAPYYACSGISFADGKMIPMSELKSAQPGTLVLNNGFERSDVFDARRKAMLEKAAADQSAQVQESELKRKQQR